MQVIGASVDKPAANERWARKHDLKMPLLSDESGEHEVAGAFGVARPMVGRGQAHDVAHRAGRDAGRKVYAKVTPKGHAAQVLADVQRLWGERAAAAGAATARAG